MKIYNVKNYAVIFCSLFTGLFCIVTASNDGFLPEITQVSSRYVSCSELIATERPDRQVLTVSRFNLISLIKSAYCRLVSFFGRNRVDANVGMAQEDCFSSRRTVSQFIDDYNKAYDEFGIHHFHGDGASVPFHFTIHNVVSPTELGTEVGEDYEGDYVMASTSFANVVARENESSQETPGLKGILLSNHQKKLELMLDVAVIAVLGLGFFFLKGKLV
jgi:hypothetical protein